MSNRVSLAKLELKLNKLIRGLAPLHFSKLKPEFDYKHTELKLRVGLELGLVSSYVCCYVYQGA